MVRYFSCQGHELPSGETEHFFLHPETVPGLPQGVQEGIGSHEREGHGAERVSADGGYHSDTKLVAYNLWTHALLEMVRLFFRQLSSFHNEDMIKTMNCFLQTVKSFIFYFLLKSLFSLFF